MLDIRGKSPGPAGRFSNFTARSFTFDGVKCASLEGILQALKYEDELIQVEICGLTGKEAQARGQERNDAWKDVQVLWWAGTSYNRLGDRYQAFLTRLYVTVFDQDESFRKDLQDSRPHFLRHSIGKSDPTDTILTELELCHRLMTLRYRL